MARKRRKKLVVFTKEYFQQQGRKGGKTGGKLRWEGVSAEDRSAHAKRAVAIREAKRAAKKKPKS
jgi:hypothetical protein